MQPTKIGPIENGCLERVDIPVPQVKENEILVKVSVCGACHTESRKKESLFWRSGGPLPWASTSGGVLNPALIGFGSLIFSPLYGISFFRISAFDTTA